MRSLPIMIHSTGDGFRDAHNMTLTMAAGLPEDQALCLCLITEEMLSLFNSVTGHLDNADFFIDKEDDLFTLHLTARQKLGNVDRSELIASSTSGRNDLAKGFLGTLREVFINAMSVGRDIDKYYSGSSYSREADLSDEIISTPQWDKFERSVLLALADNVTVGIKGGEVHLTITKAF